MTPFSLYPLAPSLGTTWPISTRYCGWADTGHYLAIDTGADPIDCALAIEAALETAH